MADKIKKREPRSVRSGRYVSRTVTTTKGGEVSEAGAAVDDETGLDRLDPNSDEGARDATHFRRIIAARRGLVAAERELRDAVQAARDAGDSWTVIGAALEVSKQAAQQKFGRSVETRSS